MKSFAIALAVVFTVLGILVLSSCTSSIAPPPMVPSISQSSAAHDSIATSSAPVLYVANLDGAPGLGQVLVYSAQIGSPKLIRTISNGTGRPFGLWVDSSNNLWVANEADALPANVTAFHPRASSPFFEITNVIGTPESVAVDTHGNVYVNESVQDHGFVQVFAPGSRTAGRTVDTGIGGYAFLPGSMAFDPHGNLIVAEQARLLLNIVKIAPDASSATVMNMNLAGINGPGMGIDKTGNMYVSSSEGGEIAVFAPGQKNPSRFISPVSGYGLMSVTPDGRAYEASSSYYVAEIAAGAGRPADTFMCPCSVQGVAVSH